MDYLFMRKYPWNLSENTFYYLAQFKQEIRPYLYRPIDFLS